MREDLLRHVGRIEIVLVDDGSTDKSWELIGAECNRDSDYVGVSCRAILATSLPWRRDWRRAGGRDIDGR